MVTGGSGLVGSALKKYQNYMIMILFLRCNIVIYVTWNKTKLLFEKHKPTLLIWQLV